MRWAVFRRSNAVFPPCSRRGLQFCSVRGIRHIGRIRYPKILVASRAAVRMRASIRADDLGTAIRRMRRMQRSTQTASANRSSSRRRRIRFVRRIRNPIKPRSIPSGSPPNSARCETNSTDLADSTEKPEQREAQVLRPVRSRQDDNRFLQPAKRAPYRLRCVSIDKIEEDDGVRRAAARLGSRIEKTWSSRISSNSSRT
jgi:hypothetical protein